MKREDTPWDVVACQELPPDPQKQTFYVLKQVADGKRILTYYLYDGEKYHEVKKEIKDLKR